MIVYRYLKLRDVIALSKIHIVWMTVWAVCITAGYRFLGWTWLGIPWLPLAVIGTAVAFYINFKNNQSYDRLWEARKIWGAIINNSRAWGTCVRTLTIYQYDQANNSEKTLSNFQRRLIYRHIAWVYTLRDQLLAPTAWEHVSLRSRVSKIVRKRSERFGVTQFAEEADASKVQDLLSEEENRRLLTVANAATQIIDLQSRDLQMLRANKLLDGFGHIQLQRILNDFLNHQGGCERISKTPFPRQYGGMSLIFVLIFIFFLPFGMVFEFAKQGTLTTWLAVPFTVLVGWFYMVMETIGDHSECPFDGYVHDVPMLALCRTIEIDLREMLGETTIPKAIEAKNGILM